MKKFEIKHNQQPISEGEIEKRMDFDKFISARAVKPAGAAKALKIYLSALTGALAVGGLSYWMYNSFNARAAANTALLFIDPPVQALAPMPDKFIINNQRDTTLALPSGSTIFIPAGSFATKEGKDVSGQVEIEYAEFHDQVDLIFSGIPMRYDTAGKHYDFESAGMFSIRAKNAGADLVLKPGKEIKVNMISYNAENYFNVYYLDTVLKKWVYDARNSRTCRENLEADLRVIREQALPAEQELIEPKKADPKLSHFVIDYKPEEFPELAVYDGVQFEVPANEKHFDPELAAQTWEYVEVKKRNDKQYEVVFRRGKQSEAFAASPVFDEKDFDKAFKEYEKRRRERIYASIKENDSLKARRADFVREADAANVNERFDRYVRNGTVTRGIVCSNLGVWNCDAYRQFAREIARQRKENELKGGLPEVSFVSETGEAVKLKKLYLVQRNQNMIYPLGDTEFKRFPISLAKSVDIVVGVSSSNKVLYLKDEELKAVVTSQHKVTFKLNEINKKDLSSVKSLLDI